MSLFNGLHGIFARIFFRALPLAVSGARAAGACVSGECGKAGLDHEASLALFLIVRKKMSTLDSVRGCFRNSASGRVMAGLAPAIHAARPRQSPSPKDRVSCQMFILIGRRSRGWPAPRPATTAGEWNFSKTAGNAIKSRIVDFLRVISQRARDTFRSSPMRSVPLRAQRQGGSRAARAGEPREAPEAKTSVVHFGRRAPFRIRLERAVAPLGHELVELGAVPGEAQRRQEILELALLVLEALQRLRAVVVEGAVAARRRAEPVAGAAEAIGPARASSPSCPAGGRSCGPSGPGALLALEHRRIAREHRMAAPAEPAPADEQGEKHEPHRPPPQESQDRKNDWHARPRVCECNEHLLRPRAACQACLRQIRREQPSGPRILTPSPRK